MVNFTTMVKINFEIGEMVFQYEGHRFNWCGHILKLENNGSASTVEGLWTSSYRVHTGDCVRLDKLETWKITIW